MHKAATIWRCVDGGHILLGQWNALLHCIGEVVGCDRVDGVCIHLRGVQVLCRHINHRYSFSPRFDDLFYCGVFSDTFELSHQCCIGGTEWRRATRNIRRCRFVHIFH